MEKLDSDDTLTYFDSHTHIHHYQPDILPEIIKRAQDIGVKHLMCNATNVSEFQTVIDLCKTYQGFALPALGIHPWYLDDLKPDWEAILTKYLKEDESITIGEIGLDYFRKTPSNLFKQTLLYLLHYEEDIQLEVFERQIKLALEFKRPVSIHCVRAHDDLFKTLCKLLGKKIIDPSSNNTWKLNILMHAYNGNTDYTKKYMKLNANVYFSLQSCCLRSKPPLATIPKDNLVIETDSPYMLNEQFLKECGVNDIKQGMINCDKSKSDVMENLNEPKYLRIFAEKLAEIMAMDKIKLTKMLVQNSKRCFNVK